MVTVVIAAPNVHYLPYLLKRLQSDIFIFQDLHMYASKAEIAEDLFALDSVVPER